MYGAPATHATAPRDDPKATSANGLPDGPPANCSTASPRDLAAMLVAAPRRDRPRSGTNHCRGFPANLRSIRGIHLHRVPKAIPEGGRVLKTNPEIGGRGDHLARFETAQRYGVTAHDCTVAGRDSVANRLSALLDGLEADLPSCPAGDPLASLVNVRSEDRWPGN